MVNDFSRAILSITEGDTIIQIENKWMRERHTCQNDGTIASSSSLNFKSFSGLFLVTGIASTSALLLSLMMFLYKNKHKIKNSIGCDHQTEEGYGSEHSNELNQERELDTNQAQNIQMTVPNDAQDDACQQEIDISLELISSTGLGVQTCPDISSHGAASNGLLCQD
jgi:ionotropic glutamate receptor